MEINDELHAAAAFLPLIFFFLYGNRLCGLQNRPEHWGEEKNFLLLGLQFQFQLTELTRTVLYLKLPYLNYECFDNQISNLFSLSVFSFRQRGDRGWLLYRARC